MQGQVLDNAFNINTPYGFLRIPGGQIAGLSFSKSSQEAGVIVTKNFNRLTGNITDWMIHFKPSGNNEEITIPQNKIDAILFQVDKKEAKTNRKGRTNNLFVMGNGDLLTGWPIISTLDVHVENIDINVDLKDVSSLEMRSEQTLEVVITKTDGQIVRGTLNTKQVSVQLDLKVPLMEISCRDLERLYVGNGGYQAAARFGIASPIQYMAADNALASSTGDTTTNSIGMTFKFVKPGSFLMGSPDLERGRDKDETQHKVTVSSGFFMQLTEVTQKQWVAVMGENNSYFSGCNNCPVERLMWQEIDTFIKKLNKKEPDSTYRLPTEAEWEYVARAGTAKAYFFGDDPAMLGQYAWFSGNAENRTHPVAQKQPNPWGFYDMYGNVWEWCADYKADYPNEDVVDPIGPTSGPFRILRGGGWPDEPELLRSANRNDEANLRKDYQGFRLVLEAK